VICGIWDLPFYFLSRALGKTYVDWPLACLWSKTMLLFFTVMMSVAVYKIVYLLKKSRADAKMAVLLLLSNMGVFYPVFITSQLDVVSLTFMLFGLYFYLKKDMKLFFLMFLIAVPCKMFAFLMVLPLLLIRQKNLLKSGCVWIATAGLIVVEKLIYRGSVVYQYALSTQGYDAITSLLDSFVPVGRDIVPFVALYIVLIVYCYITKTDDPKRNVFFCFFIWGSFMAFVGASTYWIILMIPFLVINILVNDRFFGVNVLLDTIGGAAYFVSIVANGTNIFKDKYLLDRLLLPYIVNIPDPDGRRFVHLAGMASSYNLFAFAPFFTTVFVTCIVLILILSCPFLKTKAEMRTPERWIVISRPVIFYAAVAVTLTAYLTASNAIIYSNIESPFVSSDINLIAVDGNVVTQPLSFDSEVELEKLELMFSNNDQTRHNMAHLDIELYDVTTGEVIFSDSVGCGAVDNDQVITILLNGTKVDPNDEYEIRLMGTPGNEVYQDKDELTPYFIEGTDSEVGSSCLNGEDLGRTLYFSIR
ncbi:MAG: hypothetical protein II718_08820, partial [Clostridiales bacterium]|nr:hypothetical protein [Clostridiales bacterium]